ncbi:MAG: 5-formyltetrahydrofolate cyclo-ligase [Acidimicrobiales bacterium]|nr:5-formyltetrahydrofolate cyclo-ligase [Acidimicrobiales bacterium]
MAADSHAKLTKDQWRTKLRPLRTEVESSVESEVVARLATFLEAKPGLFLFYRPMPHELNLDDLAEMLGWQKFVTTRTPRSGSLTVHPAASPTERHKFGFQQPVQGSPLVELAEVAVALVPALAFDRNGTRLGHGAGYFDQLLPRLPGECLRIGVTEEAFIFDELPSEAHDISMTHLATESGVRAIAGSDP